MILVLVLMAAYLLYDRLLQGLDTQNLAVNETYEKGSMENKNEAEQEEQEPVPAPDFVVIDADGNEVALSDFIGKPLFFDKCLCTFHGLAIAVGQVHHQKLDILTVLRIGIVKIGHLHLAGAAPACPKV